MKVQVHRSNAPENREYFRFADISDSVHTMKIFFSLNIPWKCGGIINPPDQERSMHPMEHLCCSVCQVISVGEFNNFQRLVLAEHSFNFTKGLSRTSLPKRTVVLQPRIFRDGFIFQK